MNLTELLDGVAVPSMVRATDGVQQIEDVTTSTAIFYQSIYAAMIKHNIPLYQAREFLKAASTDKAIPELLGRWIAEGIKDQEKRKPVQAVA